MENLYDKRKVYEKSQLLENQIKENPIEMFRDWFLEAKRILRYQNLMQWQFLQWKQTVALEPEWCC